MEKQMSILGSIFNPFRFPSTVGFVAGMQSKYVSYEKMGMKIYQMEDYQKAFNDPRAGRIPKAVFQMDEL